MKRKITYEQKRFLERELQYLQSKDAVIGEEPLEKYYDIDKKNSNNAMQTMLWVGTVLVGVGILSFIASNWSYLSAMTKYFIIFFGVIGFYFAGFKTEKSVPKTSRSLYYIGGFLFGSGIFLIGQAFHLGGEVYPAFFFWAIGIIPLAYYLRDKAIMTFAIILLLLYNTEIYFQEVYPFYLLIIIPVIYFINDRVMNKSKLIFFLNSVLAIHFLHSQMWFFDVNQLIIIILIFSLGILVSWKTIEGYVGIMKPMGYMIHGGYGIALTMPGVWEQLFINSASGLLAILFAIAYGLFIIFMVRKGNLLAIVILCAIIFRFYADISYDFLPKSLFFIVGGVILILFGFWFEKSRREDGKTNEHKNV